MTVPAGWYPDPGAPGSLRYHDGTSWTAHTAARTAPDPAAAAAAVPPRPLATVGPAPGARPQVAPAAAAPAARSPLATLPPVVMPFGVDGPVAADSSPTVIPARVMDADPSEGRRRWWLAGVAGAAVASMARSWARAT